jgi:hypothetical protein
MTDQEQITKQHMEILRLEDQNLILKMALREAINFAQETAVNLSHLGENGDLQKAANFLEDTISRGLRLNEAYRGLLDD